MRSAHLFLVLGGVVLACMAFFGGTAVAQLHGEARQQVTSCLAMVGVLGLAYGAWVLRRPRRWPVPMAAVLSVPAYGFLQAVPLPMAMVRIVSPHRAAAVEALGSVTAVPGWAALSVTPAATVYLSTVLAGCAVLFLFAYDLSSRLGGNRAWLAILPILVIAAAEAILGLAQAATGPQDAVATGTYANRNHYAGLLEMAAPFALAAYFPLFGEANRQKRNRAMPAVAACASLGTAALLLGGAGASLSRMGFTAAMTALLFVLFAAAVRAGSRRRVWAGLGSVAAVAVLAVVFLTPVALIARFGGLTEADRVPPWRDTRKLIAAYPLAGCGLGAYESAFVEFKRSNPALDQDYAHNDYLQYLAELGAAGFVIAACLVTWILVRLRRAIKDRRPEVRWLGIACAGSVTAIGLHSLVDFNLYVPANMMVLAWILGLAAYAGEASQAQSAHMSRHDLHRGA